MSNRSNLTLAAVLATAMTSQASAATPAKVTVYDGPSMLGGTISVEAGGCTNMKTLPDGSKFEMHDYTKALTIGSIGGPIQMRPGDVSFAFYQKTPSDGISFVIHQDNTSTPPGVTAQRPDFGTLAGAFRGYCKSQQDFYGVK